MTINDTRNVPQSVFDEITRKRRWHDLLWLSVIGTILLAEVALIVAAFRWTSSD